MIVSPGANRELRDCSVSCRSDWPSRRASPWGSVPLRAEAFDREDAGVPLRFRWFPVRRDLLADLPLLPGFLPEGLTELPTSVVHIVQRDTVRLPISRV